MELQVVDGERAIRGERDLRARVLPDLQRVLARPVVLRLVGPADLPEGTMPGAVNRTAERQRIAVRQRTDLVYDKARARKIAEAVMRSEAVSKNSPVDLINIALEKVVEAGLELPGFTTLDTLAAKVRPEVNAAIWSPRTTGRSFRVEPLSTRG
ncbi:DUF4158 domain-containing protein [Streptomyces sp. WAC01280]|nr:DUF4158 domain-containing protein [Streptomyces sp. WAC01280]